ncbi:hypothetical protein CW362_14690 [Streptomyces populi]|uniref:DUF317 domain-containing protein n=1 Tax=Streptomyces populi TaxID=2058924 RepID=A0A2I0SQX7_9ACTN|nr:DUF317 domain-containing protein [Streptomyces populi]PKT72331.1 hypothetical protein CW362_14690 [Streptomyces populi]
MTNPFIDAHVRFGLHPAHSSAVTARVTGPQALVAHVALESDGWTPVTGNTLVLARIDSAEPYWAQKAVDALKAMRITTEVTPGLREAIDKEQFWADHPMSWLTRSEIRDLCNAAQKIHDDIRHGRLLIHAHAQDGHTTVAVGTYLSGGKSVCLRGENHLRQVDNTFDSPVQALVAFEKVHGTTMRPGPAPMTDVERAAAMARASLDTPAAEPTSPRPEPETVPAYAADPGDHDALLDAFLDAHADWEKWRTWSNETTHAITRTRPCASQRIHGPLVNETVWTVAAYESPVSERMWVLTATGTTPAPVLEQLLAHLGDGNSWDTALGSPIEGKTVATATQPLTEAGWHHTVDGRWIRWTSPAADAGMQFDAFAAQHPNQNLATWTIWAGPSQDHPTWSFTASPYTPSALLADLTDTLANATGTRQHPAGRRPHQPPHTDTAPATTPAPPQNPSAPRR